MNYQKAQNYWVLKDAETKHLPVDELQKRITDFSLGHNTMALATGTGDLIRCTPVEYTCYEDSYWIMSEGGRKYIGLEKNKNVSFAIFDPYEGFGSIHGLQIDGTAELIEPFSETYNAFLAYKKIPVDAIKKMDEPMGMICIHPQSADYLDSSLKKEGYGSRQHLDY